MPASARTSCSSSTARWAWASSRSARAAACPITWWSTRFAEPVTTEDVIADSILSLARSLCGVLEERGQGARILEAAFFRTDGIVRHIGIETARPLREPATIAKLFRARLDALADPLDPGFGFDLIRLAALHAERLVPESIGLEARPDEDKQIAFLIDRLAARFGSHRILSFQAQDTHIPEAAGAAVPAQYAPETKIAFEPRLEGEAPPPAAAPVQ